jgi:hypothetical protein
MGGLHNCLHCDYDYPGFNTQKGFFYTGEGKGHSHGYAYGQRHEKDFVWSNVNDARYAAGTRWHPDWVTVPAYPQ